MNIQIVKDWRSRLPYKSQLSRFKNIENRNKAFHALSHREQRKEIALDAIELLIANKMKPSNGDYWGIVLKQIRIHSETAQQFQERLIDLPQGKNCYVCARGLAMVSAIRMGNNIKPLHSSIEAGTSSNQKYFDMQEMRDMENVYEVSGTNFHSNNSAECLLNIFLYFIMGDSDIFDELGCRMNNYVSIITKRWG